MAFLTWRPAVLVGLLAVCASAPTWAQTRAAPPLTLQEAERVALEQSRLVGVARLDIDKAERDVAALRLRRRPHVQIQSLAGTLVAPLNLVFPTGSIGTFPATGPIPATDTSITTDPRLATFLYAQVAQPITQLRTIDWGARALRVGQDLAREQVRAAEAAVRNQVRRAYFGLLQAETGLRANGEVQVLYQELDRLMSDYLAREVVLPAEAMTVRATLARHQQTAQALRHTMATLQEQLNLLMGRDIDAAFSVVPIPDDTTFDVTLETAEARALEQRPEVQQARLRVQQAGYDLERARSEAIPEVSAVFNYFGFYNVEVLPRNVAAVGVYVKWEPFDWGRRRTEQAVKRQTITQAELGVRETEASVRVEVRQQHRLVRDARALVDVTGQELQAARERLRIATERFRLDAGLRREILEAQAATAGAEQQYRQAVAQFWTARADFEKATGGTP